MSPPQKRSCPACGRVLSEAAQFCVGCGAEMPSPADPEEPAPREDEPEIVPDPVVFTVAVAEVAVAVVAPPVDPAPAPELSEPAVPEGGAMVASPADPVAPQFDRYAGAAPEPPSTPASAPVAAPPPQPRPDVSLPGAFHRLARRGPVSAGTICALGAVGAVALIGLGLGLLVRAAHASQGCAAGALTGPLVGGCAQAGATNGVLTDWNAMLWSIQGVGVSFSSSAGGLVSRVPLPLGMLLTAAIIGVAGGVSVRLVPPRRMSDIVLRACLIAAVYTTGMLLLGIAISARSDQVTVGPDNGLLLLWALFLGFIGSLLGMFRKLFGAVLPAAPLAMAQVRLGRAAAIVEAAAVGTLAALVLGMALGVAAAATHVGDTGNVLRSAFLDVTSRPLPSSPTGTVVAVVYLILGLPALATWVLSYSLIIPTVTPGTPLGSIDHGLLAGDHDAWLWAVVALPIVVTLLTGYVAARRRRSVTVEGVLLDGALGGLAFAFLAFLVTVLFDGGATLSLSGAGGLLAGIVGTGFTFGPGLEYTLGALLLWGLVGGAAGGYLSLVLLVRGVRPPFLRRYDIEPPVAAAPPPASPCPGCGAASPAGARFCSACGAAFGPPPPG